MDLKIQFNSIQQAFYEYVREKKVINIREASIFWSSPISVKGNLLRFTVAKIIREDPNVLGRFIYNSKDT